jgi:hypothetical protein
MLIAFWALFWPKRSPSPADGAQGPTAPLAGPAAPDTAAPTPAASSSAPSKLPPDDRVPMPGCWQGLRDFDRDVSITDMRTAIAAAINGGDPLLSGYLRDRLAELVGADPARALSVLASARSASGPELAILMGAVKDAPAVRDPSVADKLLSMGEAKTESIELRSAALDALETQEHLGALAIGRMKAIALDATSDSTAWMATRSLGRVMTEDFERTGSYEPYWKELLSIGQQSTETAVQLLALEMPSYADPILAGDDIGELAEILQKDADRSVREMAAHRLSVTRDQTKVLAVYRAAFPAERDECVRWAIFRFTVRVAGAGALPMLAEFAAQDPRFVDDQKDFLALYAAGTVDFARIWTGKMERHQCVAEEGMGGH